MWPNPCHVMQVEKVLQKRFSGQVSRSRFHADTALGPPSVSPGPLCGMTEQDGTGRDGEGGREPQRSGVYL